MIVHAERPITISYVSKREVNYDGKMATLWSFSIPINRKKLQDGTYKTFFTNCYFWDKNHSVKFVDKQQLNNVTFSLEIYIDNNGMRRFILFVVNYDLENTNEKLADKTWEF